MAIEAGWGTVVLEPDPVADRCAPSACKNVGATPVYAAIARPPVTEAERFARTTRMLSPPVYPSGKFCTFVATYVAIETPPAVTYSTSVYVLPTGVALTSVRRSVTDVMMLLEPTQKNVAMIASPWWGFVGLNPLMSIVVPFSFSVLFHWSRAMPAAR